MTGTDLEERLRKQPLLSCCPRCGDELGRPLGVREHPHPQPGPRPVGRALLQVTGRPGPESGSQEPVQVSGEHSSTWCAAAPPSAPFPLCHRPQEGTHGRNSGCVCPELPAEEVIEGNGDLLPQILESAPSPRPGIRHTCLAPIPLSRGDTPTEPEVPRRKQEKKTWVQTLHSPRAPALLCQAPLAHMVDEPEIHSVKLQDRC